MSTMWTLEADVTAGTLEAIIRAHLPAGEVMPGITAGRYASVNAVGETSPEWMRATRDELRDRKTHVDLRRGN